MYLMRARVEAALFALESILQTKAVTPPGAADLAAVAGRVTTLEQDQAAEDAMGAAAAPSLAAGWAQMSAPFTEVLRAYKVAPDKVTVTGQIISTAAAAGPNTLSLFTLPQGLRPAVVLMRNAAFTQPGSAPVVHRLDIQTSGLVQVITTGALASGTWAPIDFSFRTVNT